MNLRMFACIIINTKQVFAKKRGMIVIRVNAVADYGGLFHCVVDGENITVDKNITHEGINEVNKIVRYGHTKQDMSLVDAREEYACAGSVR